MSLHRLRKTRLTDFISEPPYCQREDQFKPYPRVVRVNPDSSEVDWEAIARWAVEHGELEDDSEDACAPAESPPPAIDWCKVAESFMREEADTMVTDACDPEMLNDSVNSGRSVNLDWEKRDDWRRYNVPVYELENRVPEMYWEPSRLERKYNYSQWYARRYPQPVPNVETPKSYLIHGPSYFDESDEACSMERQSRDFSCMQGSFMHDSTVSEKSDILEFLEGSDHLKVRPSSLAEGYHFGPGRAYDTENVRHSDAKVYTSTPIKKCCRSTIAETFEMMDGSKLINVTFEELRDTARKVKHVTDVRDTYGCEIMHIERDIDTKADGVTHRVEKARRWLNFDHGPQED